MSLIGGNNKIYEMPAIKASELEKNITKKDEMIAFIKGAVYCWINEHKDEENPSFVARDLFGYANKNWVDTPLMFLYVHYKGNESYDYDELSDAAYNSAAIELGWLLKEVLKDDKNLIFDNSINDYYAIRYTLLKDSRKND